MDLYEFMFFLPCCMRCMCIPMRFMRNCMRICAYLCVNVRFDCISMRFCVKLTDFQFEYRICFLLIYQLFIELAFGAKCYRQNDHIDRVIISGFP